MTRLSSCSPVSSFCLHIYPLSNAFLNPLRASFLVVPAFASLFRYISLFSFSLITFTNLFYDLFPSFFFSSLSLILDTSLFLYFTPRLPSRSLLYLFHCIPYLCPFFFYVSPVPSLLVPFPSSECFISLLSTSHFPSTTKPLPLLFHLFYPHPPFPLRPFLLISFPLLRSLLPTLLVSLSHFPLLSSLLLLSLLSVFPLHPTIPLLPSLTSYQPSLLSSNLILPFLPTSLYFAPVPLV